MFQTGLFGDVVALGATFVSHFRLYFENIFPTGQYLIRDINGKTVAETDVFHQEMCLEHAYGGYGSNSDCRENPYRREFMATTNGVAKPGPGGHGPLGFVLASVMPPSFR